MFEIIFILLVMYIAYVIHTEDKQVDQPSENNIVVPENPPEVTSTKSQKTMPQTKPAVAKTAKPKPVKSKINKKAAPKIELRTVIMKNPKTGEQAKIASNYRMAKRWVKEALVEEGLLDKIYKTNEMDETAKAEVAKALSIIKAMDKYKV